MFTLNEMVKAISAKVYKEDKKEFGAIVTKRSLTDVYA